MVRESLRSIPDGQVDATAPVTIDGLDYIDPHDPAMPMYRVIANNRQPVALRDLMIAPVRSGYIGDGRQPDRAAKAFAKRIRAAGGETVDYFPDGMPHGFYFFPGVHREEGVAHGLVAKALAGPFRR